MNDLKKYTNEEIVEMVKNGIVGVADLTDSGICPTCFNRANNEVLYGDNSTKMIYEDERFECFFVGNPRANGHAIISTKKHYKDMMEADDETNKELIVLARKLMNVLKEVYKAESVYLCTMCDGPMNHYHVQLIPRYSFEKRGSENFTKKRFAYVEDKPKVNQVRVLMKK